MPGITQSKRKAILWKASSVFSNTAGSSKLLDKTACRLPNGLPAANFTGLQIPEGYVFGYGLDYKEYLRNAPGIFVVAEEHR